ncbi:hypothetical protein [Amycolatopsis sp. La24]|uniref:hypothetical protein n=1 Tax=Amycolatopsis sp. La24 TaxID=3028304 RepID=UPI0023B09279|nr:hypothetical protein [Amycolatopsis sp. La24]
MSERVFPAPSTISEQARSWLVLDAGELTYPAADDTDGWLAMAARANQSTAQRFPVTGLPVHVEDFEVDGAAGYAARPHGVDDDAVFLWMHPGGLLVGGGEAAGRQRPGPPCRPACSCGAWTTDCRRSIRIRRR